MRQTIIVSALTSVITVVLSVVILNQLGAGTVSSASTPDISASNTVPSSEDGQLQGDTDCDGDVDAVDGLGVLVNVVGFDPLVQQEPCTDIADLIPVGDGIPGPQGPQGEEGVPGPAGPAGPQGPEGERGISAYQIVSKEVPLASNISGWSVSAACPDGKSVLGGGGSSFGSATSTDVWVRQTRPVNDGKSWQVGFIRSAVGDAWTITAYAICANVDKQPIIIGPLSAEVELPD